MFVHETDRPDVYCSDLDSLTSSVPEHIRNSIMRLSEQQREEEAILDAQRQDLRYARSRAVAGGSSTAMAHGHGNRSGHQTTVAYEEELGTEVDEEQEETRVVPIGGHSREDDESSEDGPDTFDQADVSLYNAPRLCDGFLIRYVS